MIIPGILISALTFPGVIVHEAAHQLFCRLFHIPVYDVVYFQMKNPSGYVAHEPTDNPAANFFISVGPFLVNTLLGILITLPAAVSILEFKDYSNIPALISMWLGISLLMHAFPSTGDAKVLFASTVKNPEVNILVKILVLPIVGLIYIGAFGSIFWLDLAYAFAIALLLPKLIVSFFV